MASIHPGGRLREALARGTVIAPGAFNALVARAVAAAGFEACYISGAATANAAGYPDIGLVTLTEMCRTVREVTQACGLPTIVDADTGYGEEESVVRAVVEFERAGAAASEYSAALKILSPHTDGWMVPVLLVSGLANEGLDELWQTIERFRSAHMASGAFSAKRAEQAVGWFRALLDLTIEARLFQNDDDQKALKDLETRVRSGEITPDRAVDSVLARIGV